MEKQFSARKDKKDKIDMGGKNGQFKNFQENDGSESV